MKKMRCPQCEIHRFFVKNELNENLLVNVTDTYEVVPVNPGDSLEGFDLSMLYCLGCSWTGSPQSLKGRKKKSH
jgi:hypothetical protein